MPKELALPRPKEEGAAVDDGCGGGGDEGEEGFREGQGILEEEGKPSFLFFVYAASLAANLPLLLEEYRIHINSIIYLATFTKRREFF